MQRVWKENISSPQNWDASYSFELQSIEREDLKGYSQWQNIVPNPSEGLLSDPQPLISLHPVPCRELAIWE